MKLISLVAVFEDRAVLLASLTQDQLNVLRASLGKVLQVAPERRKGRPGKPVEVMSIDDDAHDDYCCDPKSGCSRVKVTAL